MNTHYVALGEESLKRLRESATKANRIQSELLLSLLESNKDTTYGKKYGFAEICSPEMYQQMVPLSNYEDYDGYIRDMLSGAPAVLTAKPPVYYCISSGSTGGPKYLPVSEADLWMHYFGIYGTVFGMVWEYYHDKSETELFGKILQTGEFVNTYTETGVMKGIRSSAVYQWLDRNGEFDARNYTVPKEVLFPSELVDLTYIKARFALAEQDVTAIHSVFIHHVIGLMQYIEKHWDTLLTDMEHGTVDASIPLSTAWRRKVKGWLPPNPARAAELRQLDKENLADHMIRKLWKNIRYIMAIGGRTMERYTEQYANYAADIPTHHFVYGASEGMMGVASGVNRPNSYILLPQVGFFEFIPQNDMGDDKFTRPLFCSEVQVGETYELVYTNLSGLYRYRMKDVLRIEGFYGETPIVSFCYRKNLILNISDEKTNVEQLEYAIREFEQNSGLSITDYCVQEDYSQTLGRYLCYIECDAKVGEINSAEFDSCLCRANYGYWGCRRFGQIEQAKLTYLKPGAFARYKESLAKKGYETGQNKPIRVLIDEDRQRFFRMEAEEQERK